MLSLRKSGESKLFFLFPKASSGGASRLLDFLQLNQKVFPLKNTFSTLLSMRKQMKVPAVKTKGGRPPKFAESSRPITLTLPESTLRDLQHVDPDRGHAIVKLTRRALHSNGVTKPLVEISRISADTGLVVIGPSKALRQIPFLHLVEVAPARYLLALASGHDFKSLEIAINDVLDDLPQSEKQERELIVQLLQHMKGLRKSERTSTAAILFVKFSGMIPILPWLVFT